MTSLPAPAPRSALVLIDFQRDFLSPAGRMPVAANQIAPAIAVAGQAVAAYRAAGRPIAAIGNEFRPGDWLMNVLRRHAAMRGSDGARWDARVPVDGAAYFPKWAGSAFVNPAFADWLTREGVEEIAVCGLKANACVSATTRDALARGFRVTLIAGGVLCASDRSRARALARLERAGANVAA